jgi:hypothetical protein
LGFNQIAFARKDPDLAWMRETEATRFAAVTQVNFEWTFHWGVLFLSDDIVLTNKSPFAITNVKVTPRVKFTSDPDWEQTFQVDRIEPGQTYTWQTRISPRAADRSSEASLSCDQNKIDRSEQPWRSKQVRVFAVPRHP